MIRSVQFSHSVVSNSVRPHGLQHARLPCPSPTPRVYLNSGPSSQWCHPTISFSVILFSSCLQSFPASRSFPMSQFFKTELNRYKKEYFDIGKQRIDLGWVITHGSKEILLNYQIEVWEIWSLAVFASRNFRRETSFPFFLANTPFIIIVLFLGLGREVTFVPSAKNVLTGERTLYVQIPINHS